VTGPVFLGNDRATCDHVYPVTRGGQCHGCGETVYYTDGAGGLVARIERRGAGRGAPAGNRTGAQGGLNMANEVELVGEVISVRRGADGLSLQIGVGPSPGEEEGRRWRRYEPEYEQELTVDFRGSKAIAEAERTMPYGAKVRLRLEAL
jgi:hypothetical protein